MTIYVKICVYIIGPFVVDAPVVKCPEIHVWSSTPLLCETQAHVKDITHCAQELFIKALTVKTVYTSIMYVRRIYGDPPWTHLRLFAWRLRYWASGDEHVCVRTNVCVHLACDGKVAQSGQHSLENKRTPNEACFDSQGSRSRTKQAHRHTHICGLGLLQCNESAQIHGCMQCCLRV